MKKQTLKSFELVLIGHPDKVADLVSKTICDANKDGRNAIECMWGNKKFIISGETDKVWNTQKLSGLVHDILTGVIGLTRDEAYSVEVVNNLNIQSAEINEIVGDAGTGDNGIYFGGFDKVYSPVIVKMKKMCSALTAPVLREWGYRTDGKFIFNVDNKGNIIDLTINIASYKNRKPNAYALISFIHTFTGARTVVKVNPKGDWNKCFGFADCGLTGRKLACDGSCGLFSHGGGAMFGKDISKADVTVPLYLSLLARICSNRGRKSVSFSASSIIGDEQIDIYKNGVFYARVPFKEMKREISTGELNIFGSFTSCDGITI